VPALESTSEEILADLNQQALSPFQFEKVKDLLLRSDLVKFAKYKPAPEVQMGEMETVRDFVKTTRTVPKAEKTEPSTPETAEKI
jgi:hypothetical protein